MRRVTGRLLALALGAGLALFGAELFARSRAGDRWLHRPPALDVTLHPDPTRMPGVAGPSRTRTSTLGLRASELSGQPARVLAVGGSTTACEYLDQDEAWPRLVEVALDARGTWVGNAGGSGLTLADHLVQVRRWGAELEPLDVVVVLVGVNDLALAIQHRGAVPERDAAELQRRAFFDWPRAFSWTEPSRSALAHLVRRSRARRWATAALEDDVGASYAQRRARRASSTSFEQLDVAELTAELARYRERLRALVRAIRAAGAQPLLLTQPVLWRADLDAEDRALLWYGWRGALPWEDPDGYVDVASLAAGMRTFNDVLREVCAELDVALVDAAAELPRTRAVFYDDCHFNEEGARRVAALVAPALAALLAD